jgi:thiol-disulfide isomerase/thioredoxin
LASRAVIDLKLDPENGLTPAACYLSRGISSRNRDWSRNTGNRDALALALCAAAGISGSARHPILFGALPMNCLSLAAIVVVLLVPDELAPTLKSGDPAPPLAVSRWIKGEAAKQLECGKMYVVEFWATWCGPCIGCMPYLTELHKVYKDRVTFISVNVAERTRRSCPILGEDGRRDGLCRRHG